MNAGSFPGDRFSSTPSSQDWQATGTSCPPSSEIWEAVCGRLAADEIGEMVDHAIECTLCAHDLQAARQIAVEIGEIRSGWLERSTSLATAAMGTVCDGLRAARAAWRRSHTGMALMASAVTVLLLLSSGGPSTAPFSRHRDVTAETVQLLVGSGETLHRDHFELRWRGLPGARYDLRLMTVDLEEIAVLTDLEAAVYRVEPRELAGLESGTKLLWQVDAYLPEGARITSGANDVWLDCPASR